MFQVPEIFQVPELFKIPEMFKGVCEKAMQMLPMLGDVIFSTDMYHADSVKSLEQKRRGVGEKILLKGAAMKRPSDWKMFMDNDENKKQLIKILLEVWSKDSSYKNLNDRNFILTVEGKAYELSRFGDKVIREEI